MGTVNSGALIHLENWTEELALFLADRKVGKAKAPRRDTRGFIFFMPCRVSLFAYHLNHRSPDPYSSSSSTQQLWS